MRWKERQEKRKESAPAIVSSAPGWANEKYRTTKKRKTKKQTTAKTKIEQQQQQQKKRRRRQKYVDLSLHQIYVISTYVV